MRQLRPCPGNQVSRCMQRKFSMLIMRIRANVPPVANLAEHNMFGRWMPALETRRAPVRIELVSADSPHKTGTLTHKAGDFPDFRREFGNPTSRNKSNCAKRRDFRPTRAFHRKPSGNRNAWLRREGPSLEHGNDERKSTARAGVVVEPRVTDESRSSMHGFRRRSLAFRTCRRPALSYRNFSCPRSDRPSMAG